MAANSAIQWADHTFNPWRGCNKVAEGCRFCYAETNYSVKMHGIKWGPNGTRVMTSPAHWRQPLKWECDAARDGVRRRVFCASLADVFEEWNGQPQYHDGQWVRRLYSTEGELAAFACDPTKGRDPATLDDLRRYLFATIDATPHLDWLLLTKRPENVLRMWPDCSVEICNTPHSDGRSNVWIGASITTQADADKSIPELLKCRDLTPVLFVSAEPLIERVDLRSYLNCPLADGIDWLILGGESGPHARPCNVHWIRSLKNQALAASVPVFVKQLGAEPRPSPLPSDVCVRYVKDPKGGDPQEWPADLRVRDFPKVSMT